MSVPPILGTRQVVIEHLKADATLTALLPEGRIFGERADADVRWPYSRFGEPDARPGDISFPIHVFSKERFTDQVNAIAEAIGHSLHGAVLELDDGRKINVAFVSTRTVPDGRDPDAWHAIVTFAATIARDCTDPLG